MIGRDTTVQLVPCCRPRWWGFSREAGEFKGQDMSRISRYYIAAAAAYLVAGLCLGLGMGITENFQFIAVHAHINLVGWASLCLYGLVLQAFPELRASKLAPWQFAVANLGAILFLPGVALAVAQVTPVLAIIGALIWLCGALLFLVMCIGLAWRDPERGAST